MTKHIKPEFHDAEPTEFHDDPDFEQTVVRVRWKSDIPWQSRRWPVGKRFFVPKANLASAQNSCLTYAGTRMFKAKAGEHEGVKGVWITRLK